MLTPIMLAAFLAGASAPPPATNVGRETAIPRISGFLDWVADPKKGVYVRGDTGKWYYARAEAPCPRLRPHTNISFVGTVQNRLDRFSSIIVEGWRCQLTSVVESPAPPGYERHHTPR
jgi:hypothetical protein